METKQITKQDLVYPELSYKIVGALFEVFNQLGSGYQEKYYQRAVAKELENSKLPFKEQIAVPLAYKNEKIGDYYLDFLIDNKVILELKKDHAISKHSIEQVYAYLKAANLNLGIIANFTAAGVRFKRILNVS